MEYKLVILGAGMSLVGVVVTSILNHYFQQSSQNRKMLLEKKLDVYSEILSMISESFMLDFLDLEEDHNKEVRIKSKLIKTLSKGRLLAGEDLEIALRDVFEKYNYFFKEGKFDEKSFQLETRVEQLMRKELGNKKLY